MKLNTLLVSVLIALSLITRTGTEVSEAARQVSTATQETLIEQRERSELIELFKVEADETDEAESYETDEETDNEEAFAYLGCFWITGYDVCLDCCEKLDGITASGTVATVGVTVAADDSLPFGTVLWIDGIGERVVEDRGGGIDGQHIDVLCEDHEACYAVTGWYDVYAVG